MSYLPSDTETEQGSSIGRDDVGAARSDVSGARSDVSGARSDVTLPRNVSFKEEIFQLLSHVATTQSEKFTAMEKGRFGLILVLSAAIRGRDFIEIISFV